MTPTTADGVRSSNRALDNEILGIIDSLYADRLGVLEERPEGEEAWSAAIVMGHLGEFPRFFAGELRRWLADPTTQVGRTHEHPERLAAVEAARDRSFQELRAGVVTAFDELAEVLAELTDQHLTTVTQNVKYGHEPLTAFLDRYVLGHKRSHADQLIGMPAAQPDVEETP